MAAMASQAALTVNFPRWQVGQRAVVPVGEEFLDDGLVAVLPFGLDGDVWRSAPRLTAITWRPGVLFVPGAPGLRRGLAVGKARTRDADGESRPASWAGFTEMASGEGDCRVKEAPDIGDEQLWVLEQ